MDTRFYVLGVIWEIEAQKVSAAAPAPGMFSSRGQTQAKNLAGKRLLWKENELFLKNVFPCFAGVQLYWAWALTGGA